MVAAQQLRHAASGEHCPNLGYRLCYKYHQPVTDCLFCMISLPFSYAAPFADIYRGMAEIGTKGFGALPKYCTLLMGVFFIAGDLQKGF
jgi:hypothetical protein